MAESANPYMPNMARIESIREETRGARAVKTFKVVFEDESVKNSFTNKPGQLCMLSVFGKGESMISITSPPTRPGALEFSVMKTGKVTSALHEMNEGDCIGVRGPYGNGFPVEEWKGKNLYFIAGGIGLAPVRSVMNYALDKRGDYGNLSLIYGARASSDFVFSEELAELEKRDDFDLKLCLDCVFEKGEIVEKEAEPGWKPINMKIPEKTVCDALQRRFTAFVPQMVLVAKPNPENAIAITCGPPIMIKLVVENLEKMGFTGDQIYTTLENKMKCGVGKCGRCNVGKEYVCRDGPVFSYTQIRDMPQDF